MRPYVLIFMAALLALCLLSAAGDVLTGRWGQQSADLATSQATSQPAVDQAAAPGQVAALATVPSVATSSPTSTSTPAATATANREATDAAAGLATAFAYQTAAAGAETQQAISNQAALDMARLDTLRAEQQYAAELHQAELSRVNNEAAILGLTLTAAPTAEAIRNREATAEAFDVQVSAIATANRAVHVTLNQNKVDDAWSDGLVAAAWIVLGGGSFAVVVSLFAAGIVVPGSVANRIAHKRDVDMQRTQLQASQAAREAEQAAALNVLKVTAGATSYRTDKTMTRERLTAFIDWLVLTSGRGASSLTPSTDARVNSHREWSDCANELARLGWCQQPRQGSKGTMLTDGRVLGDVQDSFRAGIFVAPIEDGQAEQSAPPSQTGVTQ